ncbi:MAG: response regulator, partial [Anaeromyxobacteraceae bacterium]
MSRPTWRRAIRFMISTRVLIVEPDHPLGLSLASVFQDDGWATRVAGSAAEAEMEIATRRPDLVVLRAELPDLSGFSLCARLRHHVATERLPIVLYSSDTAPGSLAEHARTPWAANGYLAMPVDTEVLRALARRILSKAEVVESADDAVIEEAELVSETPAPHRAAPPALPSWAPPPVPRREVRSTLTEEDRLFVERTFQSIADRRDALLAESRRNRPPPRRDLLQTADGRLQLLRDDLKAREAQLARLAEVWDIREREVAYAGEWLHEKDVELQGFKGQVEHLAGRLAEARALAVTKEREHGAALEAMRREAATRAEELNERITVTERGASEAQLSHEEAERRHETDWRVMEERLATLDAERRTAEERAASLEAGLSAERTRAAA